MNTTSDLRARNLRTVALLAALFFMPLALSFWLYYGTDWRPAGRANHGELIHPPVSLPRVSLPLHGGDTADEDLFTGKWTLVYVGSETCDETCRNALYVMRQVRLALNKDMTRVRRVLVAPADCCAGDFLAREHAGLIAVSAEGAAGSELLRNFPQDGREHSIFIVDPLGNLMMRYDARRNPKGLLEDLERLLRLSHIG